MAKPLGADAVHDLRTDDGLTLTAYEWGTSRAGDRPPVVLQHGFIAGTRFNWVEPGVVDALVAAGFHVVALDARGHGASEKPHDSAFYGEEKMAGDLSVLYDLIGAPTVHQVGYSMGAVVSLIAASREPRIGRLIVGGVGAGIVELGGVDTRALPTEMLADGLEADDPTALQHPQVIAFRAFTDMIGADRLALAAHARVAHRGSIELADIGAPTLVVAGTEDPLAERPQVLADAIADARTVELAGDHTGVVARPDFVTTMIDFLAG